MKSFDVLRDNFQYIPELEGLEGHSGALVELALELDPVKTKGVQEGGETLH